jgi:tRNA G10  N-methylase Trm11
MDTLGDGTIKMTTTILKYNKATPTERNLGVEHFPKRRVIDREESNRSLMKKSMHQNFHPCPKPTALLFHISLLMADPGETILDPFMGSGSGGLAAVWSGFNYIGIELSPEYFEIAKARVEYALNNDAFAFPLTADIRSKRTLTERTKEKSPQFWQCATDDLGALDLLRPTTVEPAPEEYLPIDWRSRK